MATLTETAYLARKGVNIGIILLVALILLRVILGSVFGLWQKLFPAPPPPPTVAFGKLPIPNAQNNLATPSAAITYTLETINGGLPDFPTTMKIYFMPRPGPTFGSFDRMKTQAGKLGFTGSPQRSGPTTWHFVGEDNPLRTLDIDEVSGNFHLVYNFLSDLSLFNDKNFPSSSDIISQTGTFFDSQGALAADIKSGTPVVSYFRLDAGALVPTTSLSNADAVSVSLTRSDIDKTPVVYPDPKLGLISLLFSGSPDQKKHLLEARNFYTPVDLDNWATYPLIKNVDAFAKLKAGSAIYASLPTPLPSQVAIHKVYVAYLDPYPPQSYLQPVLVFSDEKGFIAYVPLVSPDWLSQ